MIGAGSWLSPGVKIYTHEAADILIGERCDIGHGVELNPGSHLMGDSIRRAGSPTARSIRIGDGCWIGARALILGGVTIGNSSVIAAGAVVIANVPPNSLVAGVPARIKRVLD